MIRRPPRSPLFPYPPLFRSAPVIARTIRAVPASREPPLEVIVVDDGSWDATAEVVEEIAVQERRVRLLRQHNAGKATALNRGITAARGEMLVCLDADTLFRPEPLGRLVAHFHDPRVGAAAGNAKVGTRANAATRRQALDYL